MGMRCVIAYQAKVTAEVNNRKLSYVRYVRNEGSIQFSIDDFS
jgi:hypothetical protein